MLKTVCAFILRVVLFMPIAALAYGCDGLQMFFGRLSDGLFDMARATRQMTMAPWVRDIDSKIKDCSRKEREAVLENLK